MYYFIVNYTGGSGKARKTWNRVHFLLKEKEIEYKAGFLRNLKFCKFYCYLIF